MIYSTSVFIFIVLLRWFYDIGAFLNHYADKSLSLTSWYRLHRTISNKGIITVQYLWFLHHLNPVLHSVQRYISLWKEFAITLKLVWYAEWSRAECLNKNQAVWFIKAGRQFMDDCNIINRWKQSVMQPFLVWHDWWGGANMLGGGGNSFFTLTVCSAV